MTEMQRQFEEWFKQSHTENVQKVDGEYVHGATERLWQAWQASRAAIVVKVDAMKDPSYEATGMVYLSSVEEMLDEAGIKYE